MWIGCWFDSLWRRKRAMGLFHRRPRPILQSRCSRLAKNSYTGNDINCTRSNDEKQLLQQEQHKLNITTLCQTKICSASWIQIASPFAVSFERTLKGVQRYCCRWRLFNQWCKWICWPMWQVFCCMFERFFDGEPRLYHIFDKRSWEGTEWKVWTHCKTSQRGRNLLRSKSKHNAYYYNRYKLKAIKSENLLLAVSDDVSLKILCHCL